MGPSDQQQGKTPELPIFLNRFLREVRPGEESIFDVVKEADGNVKISVQSRKLNPEQPQAPIRRESPRRSHFMHNIDGFIAYLNKYKTANTVIFADAKDNSISAVIDETAAKGFEIVTLYPQLHPLFEPWDSIFELDIPIVNFATFVMKNRKSFQKSFDVRSLCIAMSQVKASTRITVQTGKGKKAINGIVCETEIQGQRDAESVELPDTLPLEVPLYIGTQSQSFEVDLVLSVDNNTVIVNAVSADVLTAKVKAYEEMIGRLQEQEGLVVTMGKPGYRDWDYLK